MANQASITGPKSRPTLAVPRLWRRNSAEEHEDGERHDVGLEPGGGGLQALDGGEHRDRRGDQAVAVEQGQPAQREDEDQPLQAVAPVADRPGGEGAQRQHAALAAVVGAQDEHDVLDADDQDQRPEDEREHAEHGGLAQVQPAGVAERLAHRVERAGADVAVGHAERGEREASQAA